MEEPLDLVLAPDSAPREAESGASSVVEPVSGDLAVLAGPDELGRALVVGPGQAAPAPWADAPRFVVDAAAVATPGELVGRLQPRWVKRRRYVVELDVDLPTGPTERDDTEPWRLNPSFTFPLDQLVHLVWANAVDLRDPAAPSFGPRSMALSAGAEASATADIALADGQDAWCDGGPLDVELARRLGTPLLPAPNVGRLEPFGLTARPPTSRPTSSTAVAHRGGPAAASSPRPARARPACSPSGPATWSGASVPPGALCLVAFNKRAAEEMGERTGRPPRPADPDPQRPRPGHPQRRGAPSRAGRGQRRSTRSTRPTCAASWRPGDVPPAGQHRSRRGLARRPVVVRLGLRDAGRGRGRVRRRRRRLRRVLPPLPGRAATGGAWSTSTSRSTGAIEAPADRARDPAPPPSGPAGCCWSTSSRT